MKQFIKKFIGEVLVTVGVGIFSFNIFNFDYQTYEKGGLQKIFGRSEGLEGIAYYYHNNVLTMIAVSAILITIGILIIKNKQR